MQEVELKFALERREDYERIVKMLGGPEAEFEQTNHYFFGDAGGILERGEALLRLRIQGDRTFLAFKEGLVKEGALFRCREVEAPLDEEKASAILVGAADPLTIDHPASTAAKERLGSSALRIAGASRTHRSEFLLDTKETLQVDRSTFPGGREDWELELETGDPPASERRLRGLAGRMGIVLQAQTRSKYRRFLDALRVL
ncbi:MAG: CYTH domain-containing protein [Planctomycetota bacterium]|jgi:uncharacterized protein YjbK